MGKLRIFKNKNTDEYTPHRDRVFVANFGRYEGDQPAELGDNEVLVGREKQRMKFSQYLFEQGDKGAILVTGNRGSGKTSFVKTMLADYKENIYERVMRSQNIRGFFWDYIFLTLVNVLIFSSFLWFSLFFKEVLISYPPENYLYRWLLLSPFFIFIFYPFALFIKEFLFLIKKIKINEIYKSKNLYILIFAIVFLVFLLYHYTFEPTPHGNIFKLLLIYLSIFILLYLPKLTLDFANNILKYSIFIAIYFSFTLLIFYFETNQSENYLANFFKELKFDQFKDSFIIFLLIITIIFFLNIIEKYINPFITLNNEKSLFKVMIKLIRLIFIPIKIINSLRNHNETLYIFLKSIYHLLIFIQFFLLILSPLINIAPEFLSNSLDDLKITIDNYWKSIYFIYWILFHGLMRMLLSLMEYHWIVQPAAKLRREIIFEPGKKNSGTSDKGFIRSYRDIIEYTQYTFYYRIFKNWVPLITIPVNLGFERLEYKRVIEAMLIGLQKQYHKNFLIYRSNIALTIGIIFFLIGVLITDFISDNIFYDDRFFFKKIEKEVNKDFELNSLESCWLNNIGNDIILSGNFKSKYYQELNKQINNKIYPSLKTDTGSSHKLFNERLIYEGLFFLCDDKKNYLKEVIEKVEKDKNLKITNAIVDLKNEYNKFVKILFDEKILEIKKNKEIYEVRKNIFNNINIILYNIHEDSNNKYSTGLYSVNRNIEDYLKSIFISSSYLIDQNIYCDFIRIYYQRNNINNANILSHTTSLYPLLCELGVKDSFIAFLNYPLLSHQIESSTFGKDNINIHILPTFERNYSGFIDFYTLELRVYHILIFALLYLFFLIFRKHIYFFPYRKNYKDMIHLRQSLSGSIMEENTFTNNFNISNILNFANKNKRAYSTEPFDPGSIELKFIDLISDIQDEGIKFSNSLNHGLSIPRPEIIFVFDEIDKLGGRFEKDQDLIVNQSSKELSEEIQRQNSIHNLLQDMKNLLSSSPCKFIFIGGRNLHDEWYADYSTRQPLLTSIFTSEIYLPSLISDFEQKTDKPFSYRISQYLDFQYKRSVLNYRRWKKDKNNFIGILPKRDLFESNFSTRPENDERVHLGRSAITGRGYRYRMNYISENFIFSSNINENKERRNKLLFYEIRKNGLQELYYADEFLKQLIQFLTFRSLGVSKKLKENLESLIEPQDRVLANFNVDKKLLSTNLVSYHYLKIEHLNKFRIQLLSDIYQHIERNFIHLQNRDDKIITGIFYFADFLSKFHKQAFSWSNLEKLDELLQMHRTPDLRSILAQMLSVWSDRYLLPIRNGVYQYRFRSLFALELEYASRLSENETAAFNFTLNEQNSLKRIYLAKIELHNDSNNHEFHYSLAELYELEEDYESAREYFNESLMKLDSMYKHIYNWNNDKFNINNFYTNDTDSLNLISNFLNYSITRLRILLNIGITYEKSNNNERALAIYSEADNWAMATVRSLLDSDSRKQDAFFKEYFINSFTTFVDSIIHENEFKKGKRFLLKEKERKESDLKSYFLKDFNLLFQPIFGAAWISEKLTGNIDTGPAYLENRLKYLREILPFVRDDNVTFESDNFKIKHSNFALIMAELHNKLGDMYFYKGKNLAVSELKDDYDVYKQNHKKDGLLLIANYHYLMALHDHRKYMVYRIFSSAFKFTTNKSNPQFYESTFHSHQWPEYIYRSAAGSLNDMGECLLSRVSLSKLFQKLKDLNVNQNARYKEDNKDITSGEFFEEINEIIIEKGNFFTIDSKDLGSEDSMESVCVNYLKDQSLFISEFGEITNNSGSIFQDWFEFDNNYFIHEISKKYIYQLHTNLQNILKNKENKKNKYFTKLFNLLKKLNKTNTSKEISKYSVLLVELFDMLDNSMHIDDLSSFNKVKDLSNLDENYKFAYLIKNFHKLLSKWIRLKRPLFVMWKTHSKNSKESNLYNTCWAVYHLGTISDWLGEYKNKNIEVMSQSDDIQRFIMSLSKFIAAAHFIHKSGYLERAGESYQNTATLSAFLFWQRLLIANLPNPINCIFNGDKHFPSIGNFFSNRYKNVDSAKHRNIYSGFCTSLSDGEEKLFNSLSDVEYSFYLFLFEISIYSLQKTDDFTAVVTHRDSSHIYHVGHGIVTSAYTSACSLGISFDMLSKLYGSDKNFLRQSKSGSPNYCYEINYPIKKPDKNELSAKEKKAYYSEIEILDYKSNSSINLKLKISDYLFLNKEEYSKMPIIYKYFIEEIMGNETDKYFEFLHYVAGQYIQFNDVKFSESPVNKICRELSDFLVELTEIGFFLDKTKIYSALTLLFDSNAHKDYYFNDLFNKNSLSNVDFNSNDNIKYLINIFINIDDINQKKILLFLGDSITNNFLKIYNEIFKNRIPISPDRAIKSYRDYFGFSKNYSNTVNNIFSKLQKTNDEFYTELNSLFFNFSNIKFSLLKNKLDDFLEKSGNDYYERKNILSCYLLNKLLKGEPCNETQLNIINNKKRHLSHIHAPLIKLINKWSNYSQPNQRYVDYKKLDNWYFDRLEYSIDKHSYPVFNRLRGMTVLLLSEILSEDDLFIDDNITNAHCSNSRILENQTRIQNLFIRVNELLKIEKLYKAPTHYTPFFPGIILASFCLRKEIMNLDEKSQHLKYIFEDYHNEAIDYLRKNEEMYTMKRAYYESLEDLYYFYDDFNDRDIHFQRSLQMFGSDMSSLYLELLINLSHNKTQINF